MRQRILVLATFGAAFLASAAWAAEPTVWFCPLDPFERPEVGYSGSPQYMDIFAPDAPWGQAAAHIRIFKIYPQWIGRASDAELKRQFADLKRRGIALALEFGVLSTSGTQGQGVEGFGGQGLLQAARRIHQNGGTLSYVAMDEPITFGCIYSGHNACHWTPEQMAAAAGPNLKALLAAYPGVKIGDIEVLGNAPLDLTIEHYKQGIEAFRKILGIHLAFFHADLNWKASPPSLGNLVALRKMVEAEHVPFGIIYDGNGDEPGDAAWVNTAQEHMEAAEAAVGTPDQVIFQSWHRYPKKLLPESAPDSFTHLVNAYFRTRTTLTASVLGDSLSGKLTTLDGQPIADAVVQVETHSLSANGVMGTFSATGTVPEGTTAVCFGVRANEEGAGSGAADLRIREFRLQTQSGWSATRTFKNATEMKGWGGMVNSKGERIAHAENDALRVTAQRDQEVKLNAAPVAIPTQGNPYTFLVQAQIPPSAEGSGQFAVFFLKDGHELSRATIPFRAALVPVGAATTGAEGAWTIKLPEQVGNSFAAEARYAGDEKHWPAQSTAAKGNAPISKH